LKERNLARASAPLAGQSPIGFIRPCEPTLVDRPAAGPIWSHEIQHDGFRILARKQGERVQFWSRRGNMSQSCSAAVR